MNVEELLRRHQRHQTHVELVPLLLLLDGCISCLRFALELLSRRLLILVFAVRIAALQIALDRACYFVSDLGPFSRCFADKGFLFMRRITGGGMDLGGVCSKCLETVRFRNHITLARCTDLATAEGCPSQVCACCDVCSGKGNISYHCSLA